MKKEIILNSIIVFSLILSLTLIVVNAQDESPSPTSTASPSSSSSPTTQTTCSGSAEIIIDGRYVTDVKDPITGEWIKGVTGDPSKQQEISDFEACKIPEGFNCPQPPCDVYFTVYPQSVAVIPDSNGISQPDEVLKECKKEGRIKVIEYFAPDLVSLMNKALNQLKDKIEEAIKNCACPPGSAMSIEVTITGAYPIVGLFGRQVGIAIDYKIVIRCLGVAYSPVAEEPEIHSQYIYQKTCYKLEG